MATAQDQEIKVVRVQRADLPLAVYREVAAHLSQVEGVETELTSQTAAQFDYSLSQVGHLQISYSKGMSPASDQRVRQILAYYSDRYGAWTILP